MTYKVNRVMCSTCIFSKRSPISAERFEELKATWEREGVSQECHHATINGEKIGCKGHYLAALNDPDYPHALSIAQAEMKLSAMPRDHFMRFAEAMGLITFVDVPEE